MTAKAPIPAIDDVLIRSLFGRLPPPGADWPAEAQAAWLRAAVRVFSVVYAPAEAPAIEFNEKTGQLRIAGKQIDAVTDTADTAKAA